jgi:AraC-like DNA-binding protein
MHDRRIPYVELPPPTGLRGLVTCAWLSDDSEVRVLPDACVDIVFEDGHLVVAGPATSEVIVPATPGQARLGIRFRIGSAGAALGVSANELLDDAVPLSELWGSAGRRLGDRVAMAATHDEALAVLAGGIDDRRSAARARDGDEVVREVVLCLAGGASVGEACRRVGIGERHLRRRFERAVGYGPWTFVRVQRFQRFLALAARHPDAGLGPLAADAGYADQAHLSRECRRLSGLAPTALVVDRHHAAGDKSVSFKPNGDRSARLHLV